MKALSLRQCVLAGTFLFLTPPISANVLFSLLPPGGSISGPAGTVVGWGYSLTNTDPSNWFVSIDLNVDSFADGTPTLLFDFPILSPGVTVTEAFDPMNSIGLFGLEWDVSAPIGYINTGHFVLSGQWWDGDPLNGGKFIATAPDIFSEYAATVSEPLGSAPEPPSFWLLVIGILLAVGYRLQRGSERLR